MKSVRRYKPGLASCEVPLVQITDAPGTDIKKTWVRKRQRHRPCTHLHLLRCPFLWFSPSLMSFCANLLCYTA